MELTARLLKGKKIRYKDVVKLDSRDFHDFFEKSAIAIVEIVSEVSSLLPVCKDKDKASACQYSLPESFPVILVLYGLSFMFKGFSHLPLLTDACIQKFS